MGSSSSKFKKYLQHGDEYAAMQVYQNSSELRKNLQPNFSYGDHHQHNTPIHYASRHGMKHLIRAFLTDLDGNPNKRNGLRQTSLHSVCQVIGQQKSPSALERRSYSVMLLLSWRGPLLPNGQRERIDIDAQDGAGYTALHYAAQSGLKRCVEYLIAHGANVFCETLRERLTPCDLAMRENHHDIALLLESKMVFSSTPESLSADSSGGKRTRNSSLDAATADCSNEVYSGLRAQDLQEAKDQLLVETAEMLNVPLFTAEALLRHSEWSREILLDKWMRDPVATCQLAGIQPPSLIHRRSAHHDQYQEQQMGLASFQQHQQRHHFPRNRPNILLQQGIQYLHQQQSHPYTQTLPSANKLLPIKSQVPLTKSTCSSSEPAPTNISQVPTNEHTTFPSTTQPPQQNLRTNKACSIGTRQYHPKMIHSANSFVVDETLAEDELLCEICCDLMDPEGAKTKDTHSSSYDKADQQLSCGHNFCSRCWKDYLHNKIDEAKAHQIFCPGYECNILVPVQVIEQYISPPMARKYIKFDIDAFVETNKAIKWCTYPACQRAVKLPEVEQEVASTLPEQSAHGDVVRCMPPPISHAVDCGGGHFFCWECGDEAHAPLECQLWKKWLAKCSVVNPSELKTSGEEYEDTASCLWLVTNSKPCPNCKSPIEKIDGCNHIQCVQCRHDFCWVCLESWKKHSTAGGYFRCNRFVPPKPDAIACDESTPIPDLTSQVDELRELNRFVHYYTRYKNHENSCKMEESLMHSAKKKREILHFSFTQPEQSEIGCEVDIIGSIGPNRSKTLHRFDQQHTKFYTDGVWELLKARRVLCGSYAYGYFLDQNVMLLSKSTTNVEIQSFDSGRGASTSYDASTTATSSLSSLLNANKAIFELMQNEFEEVTERLSEIIARPYLRTPRRIIIQTLQLCRRKRQEFLLGTYRGLLPPDNDSHSQTEKIFSQKSLVTATAIKKTSCRQDIDEQQLGIRKPLTQIQGQNIRISETLPGRFRLGTYQNIKVDDPWLVKENHMQSGVKVDTEDHFAQPSWNSNKPIDVHNEELQICHQSGHPNQLWSKSSNDNMKDDEIHKTQTDSMKYVKPPEILHSPMYQGVWSPRAISKDTMKQYEYVDNGSYQSNIVQCLYTLPRTSRSDDNLLVEDKQKANFPLKYSKEEDQRRIVSVELKDTDSYTGLENALATNLDNISTSREGTESQCLPEGSYREAHKTNKKLTHKNGPKSKNTLTSSNDKFHEYAMANETVKSFLKSLASKEDKDQAINANGNVSLLSKANSNAGPKMQTQIADLQPSPKKSNSVKIVRRTGEVADGQFCIGDLHESGGLFSSLLYNNKLFLEGGDKRIALKMLKRSHSTGEINRSRKRAFLGTKIGHIKKATTNKIDRGIQQFIGNKTNIVHLVSDGIPVSKVSFTKIPNENKSPTKMLQRHEDGENENEQRDGQSNRTKQTAEAASDIRSKEHTKLTDGKRIRPKFVRQKSFEIDSDSTDGGEEAKTEKTEINRNNEKTWSPEPQSPDIKVNTGQDKIEYSAEQASIQKYKTTAYQYDKNQSGIKKEINPPKEKNIITESCNPTTVKVVTTSKNKSKLLQSPKSKGTKKTDIEDDIPSNKKVGKSTSLKSTNGMLSRSTVEGPNKMTTKKRHPGLTIKIQNSSMAEDPEGDISPVSSEANEFMATLSTELARSPTLHISGIAISRSPGAAPPSPSTMLSSDASNRNRSASLVVPPPTPQTASLVHVGLTIKGAARSCNTSPRSPGSRSLYLSHLSPPVATGSASLITPSSSPYKSCSHQQQQLLFTFPDPPGRNSGGISKSEEAISSSRELITKSRETSITHALSSVLHVQDSYLSSDDFHEALFLDKKSPNKTLSRKRRKSKKRDSCGISAAETLNSPLPNPATKTTVGSVLEVAPTTNKHEVKQDG